MDFADTNLDFGNLPLVALRVGARSSGWQKKYSEVPKCSRASAMTWRNGLGGDRTSEAWGLGLRLYAVDGPGIHARASALGKKT